MSVVSTIVLVLFVASLLFLPSVSVLPIDPPHKRARHLERRTTSRSAASCCRPRGALPMRRARTGSGRRALAEPDDAEGVAAAVLAMRGAIARSRPLTIGFYVTWDDSSFASLETALPKLDWVVPSWLELTGPDLELKTGVDEKSVELLAKQKQRPSVLPMLQNATDGKWDGPGLARLLADPDKRKARIDSLVTLPRRPTPRKASSSTSRRCRRTRTRTF